MCKKKKIDNNLLILALKLKIKKFNNQGIHSHRIVNW